MNLQILKDKIDKISDYEIDKINDNSQESLTKFINFYNQIGVPKSYIEFIENIGLGGVDFIFKMDDLLLKYDEIYPKEYTHLEGMYIFASDMGEYVYAFDSKNNWEVVDIDASGEVFERYGDFETFINYMLDYIINLNDEEDDD